MKVAIIGGLGFIGRELTRFLCSNGCAVDVYDLIDYKNGDDRFGYYRINLEDKAPESLKEADAMVVLAAKRSSAEFGFDDYQGNVRIAEQCFGIARESDISNIVFASSKAVYSDQETIPWSEQLYTSPLSLYGASKVAVEQLASYYNDNLGMNIKSLRFAQVIGMGERKGYLISTLIDNAIAKKQQVVYGDGSQKRQYIYIKDVCRAVLAALSNPAKKGVYNIGMPGAVSNLELAEAVNEVFGNAGNLKTDPDKVMGTFCDEMDVRKAEAELDFKTAFGLKELFEDIVRSEHIG